MVPNEATEGNDTHQQKIMPVAQNCEHAPVLFPLYAIEHTINLGKVYKLVVFRQDLAKPVLVKFLAFGNVANINGL